jgi:hypothetical protein
MELKDLAPWIAIAFTLALSILVPLFTQIANNNHQCKMQREKFEYEEKQKKTKAFEAFLSEVGGIITADGSISKELLSKAGAAVHQLYIYAPLEWYGDLDLLTGLIMQREWNKAKTIVQKISRLISKELKKH